MTAARASTLALLLLAAALPAAADMADPQVPVLELREPLDWDRPEAWAMKHFASASVLTGLGPVEAREAGALELGLEAISIPHLDREQRTVGFGGIKEEDLNRAPAWARLRLAVGLPGGFGLVVGWTPPLEVDRVEANFVSLALEKALYEAGPWALGARLYGQTGEARADFTCSRDESFDAPGSPANPFGCREPSRDEVRLDVLGVELVASRRLRGRRAPALHFGVAGNRLDLEFQVDARVFEIRDRTLLLADGETLSLTAGATWDLATRTRLGLELFYSPLSVDRPGAGGSENDPLVNLRGLLRYRLR